MVAAAGGLDVPTRSGERRRVDEDRLDPDHLAAAEAGCVRADLGLEHSLHSTLNCYLSKLLFLLTGQFGKRGSNNLHTYLVPLIAVSFVMLAAAALAAATDGDDATANAGALPTTELLKSRADEAATVTVRLPVDRRADAR